MAIRAHTVPRFYLTGFVSRPRPPGQDPYVFVGSVVDGSITRRAPKNLSICRGMYDGPGGFDDADVSIETHLSKIEWAAASEIKRLAQTPMGAAPQVPPAVWRFVAWQAARTPAWLSIAEESLKEWDPNEVPNVVEPPPQGFEDVNDRVRPIALKQSGSDETITATHEEYKRLFPLGWRWVPSHADRLELIHAQAWYFQVRHFPRLHWRLIAPPPGQSFVTSDRGVTWNASGEFHAPPSSLRHSSAELLAPLTAERALLGRASDSAQSVTAEEVNCRIAQSAVQWIAGATEIAVQDALLARQGQNT